jgi:hypothetical protein
MLNKGHLPEQLGFVNEPIGTHSSRTIMTVELTALLGSTTPASTYEELRVAAVENNAFQKSSATGRAKTFRHLREFYTMNIDVPIFSALRALWDTDISAQPMLAFLCASARDPLIRASANYILSLPVGALVDKGSVITHLSDAFPERYSSDVLQRVVRNMLSSWTQSGHLKGRTPKFRATAIARPASTAYALYLGYLSGLRGDALFETPWARILDHSQADLHEYAREASARGWITYRSAGGITDVEFSDMIRSGYKEEHDVTH